jgi:hypothetical protein
MVSWVPALYSPSWSPVLVIFWAAIEGAKVANALMGGPLSPGWWLEGHGLSLTHSAWPSTLKGLGLLPP